MRMSPEIASERGWDSVEGLMSGPFIGALSRVLSLRDNINMLRLTTVSANLVHYISHPLR